MAKKAGGPGNPEHGGKITQKIERKRMTTEEFSAGNLLFLREDVDRWREDVASRKEEARNSPGNITKKENLLRAEQSLADAEKLLRDAEETQMALEAVEPREAPAQEMDSEADMPTEEIPLPAKDPLAMLSLEPKTAPAGRISEKELKKIITEQIRGVQAPTKDEAETRRKEQEAAAWAAKEKADAEEQRLAEETRKAAELKAEEQKAEAVRLAEEARVKAAAVPAPAPAEKTGTNDAEEKQKKLDAELDRYIAELKHPKYWKDGASPSEGEFSRAMFYLATDAPEAEVVRKHLERKNAKVFNETLERFFALQKGEMETPAGEAEPAAPKAHKETVAEKYARFEKNPEATAMAKDLREGKYWKGSSSMLIRYIEGDKDEDELRAALQESTADDVVERAKALKKFFVSGEWTYSPEVAAARAKEAEERRQAEAAAEARRLEAEKKIILEAEIATWATELVTTLAGKLLGAEKLDKVVAEEEGSLLKKIETYPDDLKTKALNAFKEVTAGAARAKELEDTVLNEWFARLETDVAKQLQKNRGVEDYLEEKRKELSRHVAPLASAEKERLMKKGREIVANAKRSHFARTFPTWLETVRKGLESQRDRGGNLKAYVDAVRQIDDRRLELLPEAERAAYQAKFDEIVTKS